MDYLPSVAGAQFRDVSILATDEPVLGGIDGNDNRPHRELAERDEYLKAKGEALAADVDVLRARVDAIDLASGTALRSAVLLDWLYKEDSAAFELFTDGFSWRDLAPIAVVAASAGDDTLDLASTEGLKVGNSYTLIDAGTLRLETVEILAIISSTRVRTRLNLAHTLVARDGAFLARTSFDIRAGFCMVQDGDVFFSRVLTELRAQSAGQIVVRRQASDTGTLTIGYRSPTTTAGAPYLTAVRTAVVAGADGTRDEFYALTKGGLLELRLAYANPDATKRARIDHMVLLPPPRAIGETLVLQPKLVAPADQASNVGQTPTLQLSPYRGAYGVPQGGARFRLARDRAMTDVILDTDADVLGAWNAVAGQTAAFADVVALGARDFLAVASGASLRIQIAQDGTITTTPGTVAGDLKRVHGSAALVAAVGVNGAIRTSTDAGLTYTVRTAAASYGGTFAGVYVRNAYVVVAGAAGMVQRSVNAGAIFNQINPDNGYAGDFTDIAGDGAGALIFVGTGGEVQTSADDGATLIKRALPGNYAGTLRAVAMTPAGFAVAVGDNGAIFTSSDRGATWAVKSAAGGFTGSFYGVAAVGRSVVAVGAGAQIQTSTDGGETFTARLAGGGASAALRAVALDPNFYGLALGDGGAFQRTLRLEGAVTSFTVPAGILGVNQVVFAQGGYYSQDGARSPLSEAVAFATAATFAYVNAPQIVQPAAGDAGVGVKPLLQTGPFATTGQADTHAASRYQIATTAGFAAGSILYDSGEVTDLLQHQVSAVTLPVETDLFVRAYHKGQALGVGAWSAPVGFRAQNRPGQPAILAPSDKATGVGLSPQITVSAFSMPGGVQDAIQIQAGTGSDFAAPLYDSGVVTAAGSFSGFRLPVGTLPAATQIYARARQRAATGAWSLWSPVVVFRTRAAGGIAEAHGQLLWTGNGQSQFVRTDLDLTPGGAIMAFGRDTAARFLVSTARGIGEVGQPTQVGDLSLYGDAYTSRSDVLNGISLAGFTAGAALSEAGKRYLAYVFRNQARFFKTGVMPSTIDQYGQRVASADLSTLGTVGAVLMKQVSPPRTPPVDPEYVGPLWYLWHRSYANEWVFNLNSFTWSRPGGGFALPTISGTTLRAIGYETPVEYLAFAHDPSADGVVQCVSFSNGQVQAYDTGWPEGVQFALLRRVDLAGGANEPWQFVDVARAPGFLGNDRPIATAGFETARDMLSQANGVVSLGPEALYGGGQYIAVLIRAVG